MSLIKVRDYTHKDGANASLDTKAIVAIHSAWTDRSDYGDSIYKVIILFSSGGQLNLELKQTDLNAIEKAI